MISSEGRSTARQRHADVMGGPAPECRTCGQDLRLDTARRDLRMAVLTGDSALADHTRMRLAAAGVDPASIEAAALKEAADG